LAVLSHYFVLTIAKVVAAWVVICTSRRELAPTTLLPKSRQTSAIPWVMLVDNIAGSCLNQVVLFILQILFSDLLSNFKIPRRVQVNQNRKNIKSAMPKAFNEQLPPRLFKKHKTQRILNLQR
jgi:hypothetical protein